MGIEPVTTIYCLGIVAASALALYLEECERQKEQRRRQEENSRRWRREARAREKEERRRDREREMEEQARREEEEENERRIRRRINAISNYNNRIESTSEYYPSEPYFYGFERESLSRPYDRYSWEVNRNCFCGTCNSEQARYRYNPEEYRNCSCDSCNPVRARSRYSTEEKRNCSCDSCNPEQARSRTENSYEFNIFERRKNSVTVTITPPQTTQNKNSNAKAGGSNNRPSATNSQGATTSKSSGNSSKQNTNSTQKASSSGSQQPQRNNNNNNNNNNHNNNNNKKGAVQGYGKLNDFIKKLKAVLDGCNASAELREKILSFFTDFEKHEEYFLEMLTEIRVQTIAIDDVLSIVIRLFQSDYFANDVAYENFIALMQFVAKYIKDERWSEICKDLFSKKPFEEQRAECLKKVLQRLNILTEITDLFQEIRKEIVEDNTNQPLEPDFSGIFTKVSHYFKHKELPGKKLTVREYFDWIRKLLILLKSVDPEYGELTNANHPRREIIFEVYSTQYKGRFRIVVKVFGSILRISTFFLNEKYDKKANDGDKYVDKKKKP